MGKWFVLLLLLLISLTAAAPAGAVRFVDIGTSLNLPTADCAAWGDYDDDGYPDLYIGGHWAVHRAYLLHNNGNGTFTDVTVLMGLHIDGSSWQDANAAWGDFDNDGALDLIVTSLGTHQPFLYHNDGDHFTDVAPAAGLGSAGVGLGTAWGDYDGDNRLDLYLGGNLYHGNDDDTFTQVTDAAALNLSPATNVSSCTWVDHNNDGLLDLVVTGTQDAIGNQQRARLYQNDGDGTFTDMALAAGLTASSLEGVAPGDYDNDGFFDLYLGGNQNRATLLEHSNGDGTFTNVHDSVMTVGANSCGVSWGDYDNDGFLDLAQANGTLPAYNESFASVAYLFHNDQGSGFDEVSVAEGITASRKFRATAWADFNCDGRLDVLLAGADSYSCLYQNTGAAADGHWLRVRALTSGTGDATDGSPVRDAIGARVDVNLDNDASFPKGRTLARLIDGGSGFLSQNEPIAQFGLGDATTVAVRVVFPDHSIITQSGVGANQQIEMRDVYQALGSIQGTVTDARNGNPVIGGEVTCSYLTAPTNVSGVYHLQVVPAGSYDVTASGAGFASLTLHDVVVPSGGAVTADFALSLPGGTIQGVVRDARTDLPIAGATVTCGSATATSGASGQYQLSVLPGADLSVTVTADGYYARSVGGVTVTAGETTALDIGLTPRTGTIVYRVKAFIDSRDDLLVQGSSLWWHHIDDGAAPGLWSGHNEATTISSTLNGTTVMDAVAWMPVWPNPYPDENRFETDSSVFTSLAPGLPGIAMTTVILAADGPMPVTITQVPAAGNEYTLIVHFQDDVPEAHWYEVQIAVAYQGPFTDVATDHWAADQIAACVAPGIVQGYWDGSYRPQLAVTRDQMAVYIARALAGSDGDVPAPTGGPTFTDVGEDHWAYKYVEYCADLDIVQGFWNGTYHPDEVVNRGQMAVYIARSVADPLGDAGVPEVPAGTPPTFPDVTADNDWAWCYKHVEYVAGLDIVQGYWDEKYHPERDVTRDQMAVYIARAFGL